MYDIAIVGGGINGVGIAADAAGRGLKVLLVEQNDLASATSSWSSKLIHGGLRYLEHYEFRLVKEALAERDVLLKRAPHIISPLKFVLPHDSSMRPTWMIQAGLWMYDNLHMSFKRKSRLERSAPFNLKKWGNNPLSSDYTKGFSYADCFVDDSRLVALNAVEARKHGADIRTYCQCQGATMSPDQQSWILDLKDTLGEQQQSTVTAKVLINAAGPWVQSFVEQGLSRQSPRKIRLIKGSHILVPSLHTGPEAFILQNSDKRVIFVIPYKGMSLVGTTDRAHDDQPETVAIDDFEIEYLLQSINQYFNEKRTRDDVLFTYSGVRPLCDDESDDPSAVTRDYTLSLEQEDTAPLLNIFGGKLTTFRKLSEAAMAKLEHIFPTMKSAWTANEYLPGGESTREEVKERLAHRFPWLPASLLNRFSESYGTLAYVILGESQSLADLGQLILGDFYEKEVAYLVEHEFAKTADDLLWRRSKQGYKLPKTQEDKAAILATLETIISKQ